MKTELCELAEKYGTDKFLFYTPFYHELFKDRRQSVKKVLELGIGYPECMAESLARVPNPPKYTVGASLYMWRDYFPNAYIAGMDNRADILFESDRITTEWFNQSDANSYPFTGERAFDIIIDDGSHEMEHQLTALNVLGVCLAPGGIYIIEDIKPTSIQEIFARLCDAGIRYEHKLFENPDLPYGQQTADIVVIRNE